VTVYVEVSLISVQTFAYMICHPADGEYVSSAIKRERVLGAKALARENLGVNRRKTRVVGLEWVRWHL
jgi:hypothetical protein